LLSGRDGAVLQYGPTRGYRPLRDATIDLMRVRHVTSTAEQSW
jgi:DNA-binding transcriptional MocR family regulator